jgi:hypothetical protein
MTVKVNYEPAFEAALGTPEIKESLRTAILSLSKNNKGSINKYK